MLGEEYTEHYTEEAFKALILEAQELGMHYTGNNPLELEGIIAIAKSKRRKKQLVPCFGLSFDPTDRRCNVCQVRIRCAEEDSSPRIILADTGGLRAIPCDVCKRGNLEVELANEDMIVDYGCTESGCANSLRLQCGLSYRDIKEPDEIVLGKKAAKSGDSGAFSGEDEVLAESEEKPAKKGHNRVATRKKKQKSKLIVKKKSGAVKKKPIAPKSVKKEVTKVTKKATKKVTKKKATNIKVGKKKVSMKNGVNKKVNALSAFFKSTDKRSK